MKQIKKRWLGLAITGALFALLGIASPANATSYTSCASVPPTVSGDADITDTACVFANDVSATGRITVTATSIIATNLTASFDIELQAVNNLKTGLVTASRNISLISSSGNIDTKDLTADQGTLKVKADNKITIVGITKTNKYDIDLDAKNIVKTNAITSGSHIRVNSTDENINITSTVDSNIDDTSGGNILLTANKSIFTRAINTHGNTKAGSVRIVANKGGTNTLFIVGTTATTNGVKGTITTNTVTGGGTSPTSFNFGISIQNGGTETSAGGITVAAMGNLKVAASNSKAGTIILDAKNGILTLPAGTLNANAASGKQAGTIALFAKVVTTASGTILSATQTAAAPGSGHSISIAAETLNLAGPTGLKIQTNGKGVAGFPALASLSPQGSVTVSSNDNSVFSLYWQLSNFASTTTDKPLTVTGAAPLTMISNGDESQVLASGFPLTFSNTDITLQSRGKTNHKVDVVYQGADNGLTNFDFSNTGTVTLDANGVGGAGGKTSVYGGRILLNAPVFNITANGPASGNGNGGEVYFRGIVTTLNPASKVSLKADAAIGGTGNAVKGDVATNDPKAIVFYPGVITAEFGDGPGQFLLSANGGLSDGSGGTIVISALGANIHAVIPSVNSAISASAIAGNGNGGEIFFYNSLTGIETEAKVTAWGQGTGKGGTFTSYYNIPNVNFNVIKHVRVDGGLSIAASDFDGSIKVNEVRCRQWKYTNNGSFPDTYWNCVNPDSPVVFDKIPALFGANIISGPTRTLLANNVSVFVHTDNIAHNAFFNDSASPQAPGYTFREPDAVGVPIIVSVQQNCTSCAGHSGPYTFTSQEFKELSAHEIGHASEYANGLPHEFASSTYENYRLRDLLNLDFTLVGSTYTQRLRCSPLNDGSAPFDGIKASPSPSTAPVDVCVAGAFNTTALGNPGAGALNSEILQGLSKRFKAEELYSQTFAFVAAANSSNYLDPAADGVFQHTANGSPYAWFSCTLARATQISTGTGTISSICLAPVPGWYVPLVEF